MLRVDIITIFPDTFAKHIYGIVRRGARSRAGEIEAHDLRAWTTDKHHVVDDSAIWRRRRHGLKPEPILQQSSRSPEPIAARVSRRESASFCFRPREGVSRKRLPRSRGLRATGFDLRSFEGVDERVAEALGDR